MTLRIQHSPFASASRRGYTMIEVLVAMGILSFGVLGFASLRTKAFHASVTAVKYTVATNLATAQLDYCLGMVNFFQMACTPTSPMVAAGGDPLTDGSCPVAATDIDHYCAGLEHKIESLPDSIKNNSKDPNEKWTWDFRRFTRVSRPFNTDLRTLAQIDVSVCWDKPTAGVTGTCGDPVLGTSNVASTAYPMPPDDWPGCETTSSLPDNNSCWCNSQISYCVHLSTLRVP